MGGLGIGIYYEQLMKKMVHGVLILMAFGQPVSGKTTAALIAMSIIGRRRIIGG